MRFAACCLLLSCSRGWACAPASRRGQDDVRRERHQQICELPRASSLHEGLGAKRRSIERWFRDPGESGYWMHDSVALAYGERTMVVSGNAKVAMKEGSPARVRGGDYLSLPAKNAHQFTCAAACTLFIVSDAAFDIHYVDAGGKEISPDEALKSKAKAMAPTKKAPPKDMKDMKM